MSFRLITRDICLSLAFTKTPRQSQPDVLKAVHLVLLQRSAFTAKVTTSLLRIISVTLIVPIGFIKNKRRGDVSSASLTVSNVIMGKIVQLAA